MGIREAPPQHRNVALLESTLGSLFFSGLITELEFNAGLRYGQIALRYLASIDAPEPYGDGDHIRGLIDDECWSRKILYSEVCEELKDAGDRCKAAVDRITIYGESPRDEREWLAMRHGLLALAGEALAARHKIIAQRGHCGLSRG